MRIGQTVGMVVLGMSLIAPVFAEGEAPAAPASDLTIDIKIATDVKDREPVGEADSFDSSVPQLVAWTRIRGADEPTEVKHVWVHEGKEVLSIPMQVKSTSYRTWSRKTINGAAGKWTFSVVDANGATLASKDFEVTAQ